MVKQCRKGNVMTDNIIKYAVLYLVDKGYNQKDIQKELNLKAKDIKPFIPKPTENKSIPTTSSQINSKNLMITETSVKGTKSVAIMTKAASEVNDGFRQTMSSTVSRTAKNSIFKPNDK